jgi:hypothetical protein
MDCGFCDKPLLIDKVTWVHGDTDDKTAAPKNARWTYTIKCSECGRNDNFDETFWDDRNPKDDK